MLWNASLQCAEVRDSGCSHGQDWTNETLVDQRIDTTVLDELPSVLCALEVVLAVQRHVAEGIAVDELNSPIEQANDALQEAKGNAAAHVASLGLLLLRNRAQLANAVDDGDQETAQ
jgi:hypothetical protein